MVLAFFLTYALACLTFVDLGDPLRSVTEKEKEKDGKNTVRSSLES